MHPPTTLRLSNSPTSNGQAFGLKLQTPEGPTPSVLPFTIYDRDLRPYWLLGNVVRRWPNHSMPAARSKMGEIAALEI